MRGMPLVDSRVELQTGVCAVPRCFGDLSPQIPSRQGSHGLTSRHCLEGPVLVIFDSLHEFIGDAHRVIGILVLNTESIRTIEVHIKTGVAQHTGLALFASLAPNELFNVGMVDIQDDHLGGAARLTT